MKRNKNNSTWTMGQDGQIVFNTLDTVAKKRFSPDTKWEHPAAALLIMAVCGILDFVMFRQLFASFLYDRVWVQWLSITGMLIGFDLAPIYLGKEAKKKKQGLNTSRVLICVFAVSFITAFAFNLFLRIALKDQVLPDLEAMTSSIFGDVNMGTPVNERALPYALFAAFLPVVTSLVSFGISFAAFNPLKQRLKKLREEQYKLERDMDSIRAALVEYSEDTDFTERVTADDDRNYQIARRMAKERALSYLDYVRERITEHVGTPSAANALVSTRRENLEKLFEASGPERAEYGSGKESPERTFPSHPENDNWEKDIAGAGMKKVSTKFLGTA